MLSRNRFVVLSFLLVLLFFMSGCAGFSITHPGGEGKTTPAGASLGVLVGDVTFPNYVGSEVRYDMSSADFTIVKTVTAEASSYNVLGLVSGGDSGYGKLWEEAIAAGADDVINIKVDSRLQRYVIALYTKCTTKMTGLAIKYNKR